MLTIDERDRNLGDSQGIVSFGRNLQGNFKAGCLSPETEEPFPSDGKKSGHRIADADKGPRQKGSRLGYNPAGPGPAWNLASGDVPASDGHVLGSIENGPDQGRKRLGRVTEVCIHDHHDIGLGHFRTMEDVTG